jgi:hypothetical protein
MHANHKTPPRVKPKDDNAYFGMLTKAGFQ